MCFLNKPSKTTSFMLICTQAIFLCLKRVSGSPLTFGIMGTLSDADKHYLAEILLGFFNRDYARITRAHFRSGWIPCRH